MNASSTPAAPPPDDRDARALGQPGDARVELVDQPRDRARRERVLANAGQVEAAHGRADVEARHVVGERRAALELDPARVRVERDRAREHHARARAPRERHDVDRELVRGVVARDEAGHHARVDRLGPVDHERHAHARDRRHRPAAQHLDVGVAAAHEHEIGLDRVHGLDGNAPRGDPRDEPPRPTPTRLAALWREFARRVEGSPRSCSARARPRTTRSGPPGCATSRASSPRACGCASSPTTPTTRCSRA